MKQIQDDIFLKQSRKIRRSVLDMIYRTNSPHIGSCFSSVDILLALYSGILNISPQDVLNPDRDRFILSKGHACVALYAVLAEKGFINEMDIEGYAVDDGTLEQHPNIDLAKGIEVSTGSLGHGLAIGTGMALSGKVDAKQYKVFALLSDGELNEGSVWEAAMFAGHHKLNNLIALIDCNKIQALGNTSEIINMDPLSAKWESFGWNAQEINGHDYDQIINALESLSSEKPNVIILNTIKGKGVSFMENELLWHYRTPDEDEYEAALKELSE